MFSCLVINEKYVFLAMDWNVRERVLTAIGETSPNYHIAYSRRYVITKCKIIFCYSWWNNLAYTVANTKSPITLVALSSGSNCYDLFNSFDANIAQLKLIYKRHAYSQRPHAKIILLKLLLIN